MVFCVNLPYPWDLDNDQISSQRLDKITHGLWFEWTAFFKPVIRWTNQQKTESRVMTKTMFFPAHKKAFEQTFNDCSHTT